MICRTSRWLGLVAAASCSRPGAAPPTAIPEPLETRPVLVIPPELPPIPERDGPLDLRVVYPPAGAVVDAGDSTFVFGQTGSGRALLRLNGQDVPVHPNGAWLAWVPLPPGTEIALELVARRGRDSVTAVHRVRRAPRYQAPPRGLWIDTTSFTPQGRVSWPAGEALPVTVRAVDGATVTLRLGDGRVVPMAPLAGYPAVAEGLRAFDRDTANLRTLLSRQTYAGAIFPDGLGNPSGAGRGTSAAATGDAVLEVARNGDTLRGRWPLQLTRMETPFPWVELDDDPAGQNGTDRITVGRATPGATYHWFFPAGTRAMVTARLNDEVRLRLADDNVAWVSAAEAQPLPAGVALAPAALGSITATAGADRVSLRLPLDWRVPYQVEEHPRGVTLRLYSTVGDPNWIRYGGSGGVLDRVTWRQSARDVVELEVSLGRPLWGYRLRWVRSDLLLELRGRPAIDPGRPFEDRLIVVDPGHPPAGATGPSGLTEAEANLGVASALAAMLEEEGARVVMTRRDDSPLDLWSRVKLADSLDADLLISIHNNALPDGVNPFTNQGSSVFYFHPKSIPLARAVQWELGRQLPLRDLGIARGDLALVRGTWMPSILVEGMFMIIPEQESALRSEAGRRAYAEAVRSGIRAFLRDSQM